MPTQQAASDPPDQITAAFVGSYDHPSYADSWQAVVDYRRVQEYQTTNPEASRTKAGADLDIPPGRYRSWTDGSTPDVVRALETAREHDWLPLDSDSDVGRGLTGLAAWIYAGGSITSAHYQPLFAVDGDSERDRLHRLAELANVELAVSRQGGGGRAEEYRPDQHATVLGRVLAALDCPVGEKMAEATIVLPRHLSDASDRTKGVFVTVYLDLRGQLEDSDGQDRIRFREARSERYLRSLAHLFSDVLDADVWQHGHNVVLSQPATQAYRDWPDPL